MLSEAVTCPPTAMMPPGFDFGRGTHSLAMMGGGLILDSGEAENTFPFRCQDRFLAYTSLLGLRSVLLTLNDAHEGRLRRLVSELGARIRSAALLQGVMSPSVIPEPMYVRCSLSELHLSGGRSFDMAARALADGSESVSFVTNQVSPTTARMLGELAELLSSRGVEVVHDAASCERVGSLAMEWHNKARFLAMRPYLRERCDLPWVSSTVVSTEEVLRQPHWSALSRIVVRDWESTRAPQEVFLKSAQDSSGNVSALASAKDDLAHHTAFLADARRWLLVQEFATPVFLAELRAECELPPSLAGMDFDDALLTSLRHQQAARRGTIPLIAQPVLRAPAGVWRMPASIGISVLVANNGTPQLIAANAQVYRDSQRRQFVGTLLDDSLLAIESVARFSHQCLSAAKVLGERGWRGPINFDGCLGPGAIYWFAGDCNPRLTALYVPLAIRTWLKSIGAVVRSVISYGYRGDVAPSDATEALNMWAAAGLLFNAQEGRGMLALPNIARRRGHDLLAINLDREEASEWLGRMRTLVPDAIPVHLESLHG